MVRGEVCGSCDRLAAARVPAQPTGAQHGLCPCLTPQGELYRHKAEGTAGEGGVALVLGAGNQLPVVALDILHKLVRLFLL